MLSHVRRLLSYASPGAWVILVLAILSMATIALWPVPERRGTRFWLSSDQHLAIYQELLARWNREHPQQPVEVQVLSRPVLEQRMMSGFLSHTPVADLMEVERSVAGRSFTGPIDQVGFVDLTDLLKHENLLEQFNAPSFSPWTSRGHIFGLPHDVHPMMLLYRADLVEAAGIDISQIETWDDYFRLLRPLMQDFDGDGRTDRYLLNVSPATQSSTEALLLQAGGHLFDHEERLTIDAPRNAEVISTLVTWYTGPKRSCLYADVILSASGRQMFVDGMLVAVLAPDWICGLMKQQVPGLAGKVKAMPLPAWTPGGLRTSVWGGTMLGIPKTSHSQAANWQFAKHVYLSLEAAIGLFHSTGIITPVKAHWSNPAFDEPDPYFSGQAIGRAFINLAPHVPMRPSSPYNQQALIALNNCLTRLVTYADQHGIYDVDGLLPEATRLLADAQRAVQASINRNVFLSAEP